MVAKIRGSFRASRIEGIRDSYFKPLQPRLDVAYPSKSPTNGTASFFPVRGFFAPEILAKVRFLAYLANNQVSRKAQGGVLFRAGGLGLGTVGVVSVSVSGATRSIFYREEAGKFLMRFKVRACDGTNPVQAQMEKMKDRAFKVHLENFALYRGGIYRGAAALDQYWKDHRQGLGIDHGS